jgi:quercetin dioxygenase-like cupin family protein
LHRGTVGGWAALVEHAMKHAHWHDVAGEPVEAAGARKCRIRWLIAESDGAPNFCMRRFDLEPGGHTPRHRHPWEHEVYVLEGEGTVLGNGEENAFRAGDAVYVPPDEEHFFAANRGCAVAFLCLIPRQG